MSWREFRVGKEAKKSYFGTGTCDTDGEGEGRGQHPLYANRYYG